MAPDRGAPQHPGNRRILSRARPKPSHLGPVRARTVTIVASPPGLATIVCPAAGRGGHEGYFEAMNK